jgi:hypothetical protein
VIVRAEASTLLREAPTQIAMAAISGFARGLFFLKEPEDGGEADPGQPHGPTPLQWRWDLDDVAPAGMQGGRTRTRELRTSMRRGADVFTALSSRRAMGADHSF